MVSEETGKVSVATFGEIGIDVPLERVEHFYSERLDRDRGAAMRQLLRKPAIRRGVSPAWIVHEKADRSLPVTLVSSVN